MSLSNRPEQIKSGIVHYEPFKMEPFDAEKSAFVLQSDSQVFRPFYDDYDNESNSFENMVPDSTEEAQKIIDNAEKIVAEAKSKAASIEQTAYEKGFLSGCLIHADKHSLACGPNLLIIGSDRFYVSS